MRKTKWLFSFGLLTTLMVMLIGGCSSNSDLTKTHSVTNSLEKLVSGIHQDGNYIFEGQEWLISKEDLMKGRAFDEFNDAEDNRIMTEGELQLDESIKQIVIYNFDNNQFVSGEYLFLTTDKEQFLSLSKELKLLLSSSLNAPTSNELNLLDDVSTEEQHVMWEGQDQSYLRINMMNVTKEGEIEYLLQLQSNAPHYDKKSLHP